MERRFNLIDEPWLPIVDVGRVSLRQVFSEPSYRALGGNPVQKIALMKLLLAIAQAACTPEDEAQWQALGAAGLAQRCLAYLEQWHARFFLYGEQPFLQMPSVEKIIAERTEKRLQSANTPGKQTEAINSGNAKSFGAGFYPDLPSENNTELSQTMFARDLSDADRAIFLISLMNFSFGGKRVESDLTSLAGDVLGNRYSAPSGPSIGNWTGQLHCLPLVDSLLGSLWVNLITESSIKKFNHWDGIGIPLWEKMPTTEKDGIANKYKASYQATLLALSRFALIKRDGILYLDGLQYPKVALGWSESSLLIDRGKNPIQVKYINPEKRAWRELQSILAFNIFSSSTGFECIALKNGIERLISNYEIFSIWSGGIKVSSNSGDQSVKQIDDFSESQVWFRSEWISGTNGGLWFAQLQAEMSTLEAISEKLKAGVVAYFKEQTGKGNKDPKVAKDMAEQASHHFWQLCERDFQTLLEHCENGEAHAAMRRRLRLGFARYAQQAFDRHCPQDTARQLDAWAQHRPKLGKYLKQED